MSKWQMTKPKGMPDSILAGRLGRFAGRQSSESVSHDVPPLQSSTPPVFHSRVMAVASGKGGVGKTNVAVNLGLSLARRGLRVAILDADLGTANVDVVLGLQPRYHLHHVVTGQKSLAEIIVEGPFGLRVIPGASGLPDLADLPHAQRATLLRSLLVLDGAVDLLLIDTSAGVGHNVVQFILAAGEVLLVTTPEPTAITDAYALMKILASYTHTCNGGDECQVPISTKLVVNNVRRRGEGEVTGRKLAAVAKQFLGRHVEMIGALPYDRSVVEAVRLQSPLVQSRPRSPAAIAIENLGEHLWTDTTCTCTAGRPARNGTQGNTCYATPFSPAAQCKDGESRGGVGRFFQQILSLGAIYADTIMQEGDR